MKIHSILLALLTAFLPLTAQTTYRTIPMDCGGWFSGFAIHSSGRLYGFGDVFGMWRSDDAGLSWQYLQGDFVTNETFINACDVATTNADRVVFMNGGGATNSRVYTSIDGGSTWGLRLADIVSRRDRGATPIIFHPDNDNEIWLASARTGSTGSLWRSINGGADWSKMGGTTFDTIVATTIYVRPEFPDQIWVGAVGGLYVSSNRGVSFTRVWSNAGGVAPQYNAIPTVSAIVRRADGVGYIATNTNGWRIAATDYNNPATYSVTATVSWWSGWGPLNATVLADGSFLTDTAGHKTSRSTDGGQNWFELNMGLITPPSPAWLNPAWANGFVETGSREMIVQDPTNLSRWFMTGGISPVISTDSGTTWKYPPINSGIAGVVTYKTRFPRNNANLALIPGSDHGVFTVTDGGLSGNVANSSRATITEQQTYHEVMSSADGLTLVAAGVNQSSSTTDATNIIIRSTNAGASWVKLNLTSAGLPASYEGITRAVMAPNNPNDFLVLLGYTNVAGQPNNPGLYRTMNGGASFNKVTGIPDGVNTGARYFQGNSWLETDGVNTNTRYLSLSASNNPSARGFWRSTDGGSTWAMTSGQPYGVQSYIDCMAVDRSVAGRVWICQGSAGIRRSDNGGDFWSEVGDFIGALKIDAANGRIAVWGKRPGDTWFKLYYSEDNGLNWSEKSGPGQRFPFMNDLAVDPNRAGQIWVSGNSIRLVNPPAQPTYEPFNYTAGTGTLANQNGGSGWRSAWNSTTNDINATGLTYTSGSNTLVTSGGCAITSGYRNSFRTLPTAYTSGTYWFSFLAVGSTPGSGYGGLSLFDGAGTERVFFGQPNNTANWSIAGGTTTSSSTGTQALIVVRIVLGAGSDTATMWINPALGSSAPSESSAASTYTAEMSFDRLRIASDSTFNFDELRFGQSFISVAPTSQLVATNLTGTSAGLTGANIGLGSSGSSSVFSTGDWWVDGVGSGLGGTADSTRFESRAVTGDHQVLARFKSVTGSGSAPRAGLMIRESTAAGARYVMIALPATASGSYRYGSRTTTGAVANAETTATGTGSTFASPDGWLLLERNGDTIHAATASTDTGAYTTIATVTLPGLANSVQVGIFSLGGTAGATTRAVVSNFLIMPVDVYTNLTARWRLDNSLVATPSAFNGTAVGAIAYTAPGKLGTQALSLPGTSTIYVNTPYVLNPQAGDFTATAWVRLSAIATGAPQIILQQLDQSGTGRSWLYRNSAGKLATFIGNSETATTTTLNIGAWYHVAIVKKGATGANVQLYINGVADGAATARSVESSTGALRIGAHKAPSTSNQNWNGQIDDVRIYNRALVPSEILSLFSWFE